MKFLVLLGFIGVIFCAQAEIVEEFYSPVRLKSTALDYSLGENQAKYTFEFSTLDGSKSKMLYSIIPGKLDH